MSVLARTQMSKPSAYPATTSYSYPTRVWTEQSPSSAPSSQTQILESTVQKPFALRPTVTSAPSSSYVHRPHFQTNNSAWSSSSGGSSRCSSPDPLSPIISPRKQYREHAITSSPQSPKTARYPRGNEVPETTLHSSPRGHHRDYTITSTPKSPKTVVHPSRHHHHHLPNPVASCAPAPAPARIVSAHTAPPHTTRTNVQTATQIPPVPRTPRTHQFFVPPSTSTCTAPPTPTRAAPPIPHSSATNSPRNNTASPCRPSLARPPAYRQRSKSDVTPDQLVSYGQRRVLARPRRDTSLLHQRPSTANSREDDQERRERERRETERQDRKQRERAEKNRRRTEGMVPSGRGEVYGERGDFLGFEKPVGAVMMKKVGKVVVVGTAK